MNLNIGFKQYRVNGCNSYLVFDRSKKRGALIDPHLGLLSDYRNEVIAHSLKLDWVLDTHVHADHASATHLFFQEYKCPVIMSSRTASQRPTRKVVSGDLLEVGDLKFKVLETPGHTPDSISIAGEGLVFTGDTLLIGATGRTDFGGSNPSAEWKSINEILGRLPDLTVVYPGHDYSDLLFSTIANEKKKNLHWNLSSEKQFINMKLEERIENPSEEIRKILDYNLSLNPKASAVGTGANVTACGKAMKGSGSFGVMGIEKYTAKLKENMSGVGFYDVRESDEFSEGHIPGVQNMPLSELGLHLNELLAKKRIYLNCRSGGRSSIAAKTLSYLGHADVVNIAGGFQAYLHQGLTVEK